MNYIIKCGRNFAAISDIVSAELHKHWMLQIFLNCEDNLNIEVDGKLINCNAALVNMNTVHTFNVEGKIHFTMLLDPTTQLGRLMRRRLKEKSFYVFPHKEATVMQQNLKNVLLKRGKEALMFFVKSIDYKFASCNIISFDERIEEVLNLLNDYSCEDEFHQIKYLSQKMHISESYLAHLFKKETGIPLKSYIVLRKLQRAYELIFNGENITTAALNAGFDSSSHLAYTNKMMTGMSATNIIRDSGFLKVF
ncbi:helix-turn-helix transcriptional regulator [Clostridium guangxiense]|uniref:helix-turn-helix transcriptional regulator n=1 Tax=Clostridium guangxiense TaxID=1662055 RepID=UPI001E4EF042|nr:helix-turn-helix transcriptional regulator [Clostridium guangxiense]MCD2346163.1 helix-turn-helix transcriptional regulator [Clostridium guangxiense]